MGLKRILFCLLPVLGCGLLRDCRPETEEEGLIRYSLRPIASEEQLRQLFALSPPDREDWLRRFWKELDPTPTTPENERKDEHERRVAYALEHYSTQFWGRPWDDRGDIYIKFGEPDDRNIRIGPTNCEIWHYHHEPELVLQFDEEPLEDYYRLFGRLRSHGGATGVGARGQLHSVMVKAAAAEARAESKGPAYECNLDTSLPYYVEMPQFGGENDETRVELLYVLPTEQLDFQDGWAEIEVRATVFDSAYGEVVTRVAGQRFSQDDVGRGDLLIGTLDLSIPPADYRLGFRLEDLKARRMGILKSNLTVRDFSELAVSDLNLESPILLVPRKESPGKGELPLRRVFKMSQKIVLVYEIYGLARSPTGRTWYETEYLIRAHRRGVGDISSTFGGKGDSSEVKNKLRLDLSASPPGDYDLVVTVRDMIGKKEASAFTSLTLIE